ncbi:serine/threonine protein kinase Ran1 [Trifolium repens]|nr:serine/threonine protein kinase Ran1 [Trifolium repens]
MFLHHDSKEGSNDMQAKKLFETLKDCVVRSANGKENIKPKKKNNNKRSSKPSVTSSKLSAPSVSIPPSFEECTTPQQTNGYDCGLFVLAIARAICSKLRHQPNQEWKGVRIANTNLIKVVLGLIVLTGDSVYTRLHDGPNGEFYRVPLFFMKVVCPHIPFMYSLLLWRCGPFLMAGRALRNGSTNMDVLIAVGTTASYVYSVYALLYGALTGFWSPTYFETSAMLITFVLLGKYLEVLAKGKTSDAIKKLVELAPATALLIVNDKDGKSIEEREIDSLLVQPGDTLKVLPGGECFSYWGYNKFAWLTSH